MDQVGIFLTGEAGDAAGQRPVELAANRQLVDAGRLAGQAIADFAPLAADENALDAAIGEAGDQMHDLLGPAV